MAIFLRKLFGLRTEVVTTRRGVTWRLNLKEGIDFAIYFLGGFELGSLKKYTKIIRPGDVVLDIGANIGAHTLPLAVLVGDSGKVYSFEPTAYAFAKQLENIALNSELAPRIVTNQVMLIAAECDPMPGAVYSSWPLEAAEDLHADHHGRLMATHGALKMTLDAFVHSADVVRVDFIKLDVDGNEYDVLLGAKRLLGTLKPKIVLELAPYVYNCQPERFGALLNYLWALGYELCDLSAGHCLPRDEDQIRRLIPDGGGVNVLARQPEYESLQG